MQDKSINVASILEAVTKFKKSDDLSAHLERLEEMFLHRILYTKDFDISQEGKLDMQYTYNCIRELIKIVDSTDVKSLVNH